MNLIWKHEVTYCSLSMIFTQALLALALFGVYILRQFAIIEWLVSGKKSRHAFTHPLFAVQSPRRPRVVREVSKALGEDVAAQLSQQLGGGYEEPEQAPFRNNLPRDTAPVILR